MKYLSAVTLCLVAGGLLSAATCRTADAQAPTLPPESSHYRESVKFKDLHLVPDWLKRYYGRTGTTSATRIGKNHARIKSAFIDVVATASKSTVRVLVDDQQVAIGTVIDSNGLVLTKASVLTGPATCRTRGGYDLEARVVKTSDEYDLALLQVDSEKLVPIDWGHAEVPPIGSWAATPSLGIEPIAIGIISALPKEVERQRVVLGIVMEETDVGPRVSELIPSSGAEKAGVEIDDVVLSIEGHAIRTRRDLLDLIRNYWPGEVLDLRLLRDDEVLEKKARLGRLSDFDPLDPEFPHELAGELSKRRSGFPSVLQHDSIIMPYHCGSPLVDVDGRVIGVNIARADRVATYAIPAREVRAVIKVLRNGKAGPEAALGDSLE